MRLYNHCSVPAALAFSKQLDLAWDIPGVPEVVEETSDNEKLWRSNLRTHRRKQLQAAVQSGCLEHSGLIRFYVTIMLSDDLQTLATTSIIDIMNIAVAKLENVFAQYLI